MRRGVQAKKKKGPTTALIAIGLNVLVWGGLGLLFTIHKIAQVHEYDVTMAAIKQVPFKPIKPPAEKKVAAKAKAKPQASKAGKGHKDSGPPHPHFMASSSDSSGGGSGQTVQSGGSGKAGQLFNNNPASKPSTGPTVKTPPVTHPDVKPNLPPPPPPVTPDSTPKVMLHQAPSGITRDAAPIDPVNPVIPDALRNQDFKLSVTVMVVVDAQGNSAVSLAKSSGNDQVDQLVMVALKKWQWNPAMADGVPIPAAFNYVVKLQVN